MKFKNNAGTTKVRIAEEGGYKWKTVKSGEIIDIPENIGLAYNFEKVEEIEKPKGSKKSAKKKSNSF